MKLNTFLAENKNNIRVLGFKAFKDLVNSKDDAEVVLATVSANEVLESGATTYFAPILPRGTVFHSSEEIIKADLDVQEYSITKEKAFSVNERNSVIVSRHKGTIDYLLEQDIKPQKVLTGNVTAEDIKGFHVIGTLPPHLVTECKTYTAVTIKDFDYKIDGDLKGDELINRLVIQDTISLSKVGRFILKNEIKVVKKSEIKKKISLRVAELISEGWVIEDGFTSFSFPEFTLKKEEEIIEIKSHNKFEQVLITEGDKTFIEMYELDFGKGIYIKTKEDYEAIKKIKKERAKLRYMSRKKTTVLDVNKYLHIIRKYDGFKRVSIKKLVMTRSTDLIKNETKYVVLNLVNGKSLEWKTSRN